MAMKLNYRYYVVNSDGKIVCGFESEKKAVEYANKNRYRVFSSNNLKNKGIDACDYVNWSVALFDASSKEENNDESKE